MLAHALGLESQNPTRTLSRRGFDLGRMFIGISIMRNMSAILRRESLVKNRAEAIACIPRCPTGSSRFESLPRDARA